MLIAASGGADSTALLLGLSNLAEECSIDLHVAHLHHGLRSAADLDLAFVRDLCARVGLPFASARWNTKLRMKRRRLSGQAGLRTLRREFLTATAHRIGAETIATAHTGDDQLETLFLRLMRGTGLEGLAGMRPRRGIWIKPLLETKRSSIESDLRDAGQDWREDESNRDLSYARNRVRHWVVPSLLRAFAGPDGDVVRKTNMARAILTHNAQRVAAEAGDAVAALESWIDQGPSGAFSIKGAVIRLDSDQIGLYPVAVQRTLLRGLWSRVFPSGPGLTRDHVAELVKLLSTRHPETMIELPGGRSAMQDRGQLRIGPRPRGKGRRTLEQQTARSTEWKISRRWLAGQRAFGRLAGKPANDEFFAAEGLDGRLELRAARADEEFVPFGRRRAVRLGSFLSRQRITVEERVRPTVLADARGILWVVGVRRSARAPLTSDTRKALWVHAEHS